MLRHCLTHLTFSRSQGAPPPLTDTGGSKGPGPGIPPCKLPIVTQQKGSVRELKSERMDLESKTSPNFTLKVRKGCYLSAQRHSVGTYLLVLHGTCF